MFTGKNIRLRSYKIEEVETVLNLIEEEGLRDTLSKAPIFPYSFEDEKAFIEGSLHQNGFKYNFAIELIKDKSLIGGCGIHESDEKNRNVTIGIWVGKAYQGLGYGSDALRVLSKFIFEELNMHKIKLRYYAFNKKARICYDAVGFKEEGVHKDECFRWGRYNDEISMSLFREDLRL